MKKLLGFIISLIMMFLVVGCSDKNTDPLPIIPSGSNSSTDTPGDSNEPPSDSTETEDDKSVGNGGWSPGCY